MGAIEAAYRQRTRRSAELAERTSQALPGGDPRASAHHLWDVDGHRYVDLLGNYTSLVHGHEGPATLLAEHGDAPPSRPSSRPGATRWPPWCSSR